ncbi:MAG: hypothetical protein AB1650_02070 [Candidatus Omnitrophota bacterium]
MPIPFKNLFGIEQHDVKPVCIITPFLTRTLRQGLHLSPHHSATPFRTYQHPDFTVIETKAGSLFNGDTVLALKNSPCNGIIFIGTCGSLDHERFPIGTIVTPEKVFAMESFTSMLLDKPDLIPVPVPVTPIIPAKKGQCVSVGSLILEEKYMKLLKTAKTDIVDMECASVMAASNYNKFKTVPLLHVADLVSASSPFVHDNIQKAHINHAQNNIVKIINQLNGHSFFNKTSLPVKKKANHGPKQK